MKTIKLNAMHASLIVAGLLSVSSAMEALAASGQFTFVTGNVQVETAGRRVPATRGMDVNPNDLIITGADGMAQLSMVDQARLSLRFNSQLRIDSYATAPGQPTGAVLNLVRGTLRTFTGLLNNDSRQKYVMKSRVATVGIRGSGNLLFVPDDNTTYNYTIEGSHITTDLNGNNVVTFPNQTSFIALGQNVTIIPTPPEIRDAATNMTGTGTGAGEKGNESTTTTPTTTVAEDVQAKQPAVTVQGGNGLGFTVIDTLVVKTDPLKLQSVVIANAGSAFVGEATTVGMTFETSNLLRGYSAYAGSQSGVNVAITGGNSNDVVTINNGTTKVVMGRWGGASGFSINNSGGAAIGSVHWIYGNEGYPSYLSDVLTGTAAYTLAGNTTPTSNANGLGSLTSASMSVNFTARTLSTTLNVSMPAVGTAPAATWSIVANNLGFVFNSFFAATGGNGLVVTNGSGASSATNNAIFGSLEGSFVGSGLNAAILGYGVSDGTNNQSASGVAAFTGPAQSVSAQYRDGIVSDPTGSLAPASYLRSFATTNRPTEVTVDTGGKASTFAAPAVSGSQILGHQTYASGTANVVDAGFDATTGLVWGRWTGGNMTVAGDNVSLANRSLQYIFGPTQTTPVELPLTGTASYTRVGNTLPTDVSGNVGVLNSASLNANFTAKTVDTALNLTIAGQTWTAAANGVPIYRDQYFSAYAGSPTGITGGSGPAVLGVSCTPSCTPSNVRGSLDGFFTGAAGEGAGILYNLNNAISGTVAFKR